MGLWQEVKDNVMAARTVRTRGLAGMWYVDDAHLAAMGRVGGLAIEQLGAALGKGRMSVAGRLSSMLIGLDKANPCQRAREAGEAAQLRRECCLR